MKILQLTNKIPVPPRDGGSIATYRLSLGLAQLGHQVSVLAMNTSKHYVDEEFWGPLARKSGFQLHPIPVNTRVSVFKALNNLLFSKLPYTAARFKSNEFRKALIRLLKETEFDLIIIENLYPILYLHDIRKFSRGRVVMRPHNMEHEIWDRTASQTKGLKKIYLKVLAKRIRNMEIRSMNTYDFLAPITKRDLEAFERLGNKKPAACLSTGVAITNSYTPIQHTDHLKIAHLGALDWAPNQEGILWFLEKVWPLVKLQVPRAEFHLAGRNAPDWFIKKARNFEVNFHGEVDSAIDFIRHFPIHIVPLWSGSGMRIKIIEAMAQGRVIVTTPIGVEGIAANDNMEILIREDPESFAEALIKLHSNPHQMEAISQNAFTFVQQNFENRKLIGDFVHFIDQNATNG